MDCSGFKITEKYSFYPDYFTLIQQEREAERTGEQ
jgi:hypothetical protein